MSDELTEDGFKAELDQLLLKYNAKLSAYDHWQGYSECGQDIRISVDLKWPLDDIDLGQYYCPPLIRGDHE